MEPVFLRSEKPVGTSDLPEAEELCDRLVIINRGKIVAGGTPAQIKNGGDTLEEAYVRLIKGVEA